MLAVSRLCPLSSVLTDSAEPEPDGKFQKKTITHKERGKERQAQMPNKKRYMCMVNQGRNNVNLERI